MLKKFLATLDIQYAQSQGMTRLGDIIPLRYSEEYRDRMREEIKKIDAKNKKNAAEFKDPVQIEVSLNIHYQKRSVDQNSWLWSAHTLEAKLINTKDQAWCDDKKITWYKPGAVTPDEVHEAYMERYAPVGYIDVEPGFVSAVRQMMVETMGRVIKEEWNQDNQKMVFTVRKTSSYMNTAEFYQLAEKVKENLLSYGVDLDSALDYKQLMNDLDTLKKKSEAEAILENMADPVKIVKKAFKGEELELF